MDLPAADGGHEVVADTLDLEAPLDEVGVLGRHLDRVRVPQEVGRSEQEDVQHVALDPLPAVQQPPELVRPLRHVQAEQPLEAVHGAHLVGDRADPADPRHDVGHLVEGPAGKERLEEPGWLVDLEPEIRDLAIIDRDVERALSLHARDDGYVDRSVGHGAASSRSRASAASRKGGAHPVMKRNRSAAPFSVSPSSMKRRPRASVLFEGWAGPKQP